MIKVYVKKYIDSLTTDELKKYLNDSGVFVDNNELVLIYDYIKKNWQLVFSNKDKVFSDLKQILKPTTYDKLLPILLFYNNKYSNYL